MSRSCRIVVLLLGFALGVCVPALAADQASGSVSVQKLGVIPVSHVAAYAVRDQRNAHNPSLEVLLSDVVVDVVPLRRALDPHIVAINAEPLKDRNYVLLWVRPDGSVSMNATYSKTMTQILNDTTGGLKAEWTTRSATRIDGRVFSPSPLKTMDGTTYTVDVKFSVDVPEAEGGSAIAAGGGEAGKALTALLAAASRKNWPAIQAASTPEALKVFDKSYNTPAENASSALDLLKAWIPTGKLAITGGRLSGGVAVLEAEGELFPGFKGLSLVRMVKTGAIWQFDQAARVGMVP